MSSVPAIRIRSGNSLPVRQDGDFVLYWMIASRRVTWNFALDRAVEWAEKLQKPLVILEALRCGYPWASERIHRFVLDGMAENACWLEGTDVLYYPYLEPEPNAGKGMLAALASRACVVVTDDFPCFFLPRMVASAARQVRVLIEVVDSNGLLPMRQAERAYPTAYAFRRFLQKELPRHLGEFPKANALLNAKLTKATVLPFEVLKRWPKVSPRLLNSGDRVLASISLDHEIPAVETRGGSTPAQVLLRDFLRNKFASYVEARNEPEENVTSELSPYLHFGHISVHQIFSELTTQEGWSPDHLALRTTGSRSGWWGASQNTEAFLDQVITWRELGFNCCQMRKDYDQFESLPAWALKTLRLHTRDERSYVYTLEKFERAKTHDPLWNAAQTQLLREGRIHNYLRMLWGKKILEWTRSPAKALEIIVELNNKYALDGRDPNSYSGIFWCLGRYDRPWGPERPVFGTVRYMSSENTARKFNVRGYIRKYSSPSYEGVTLGQ
ncbi:MAG: deoxyribodipyrimidine photolyase [Acidobacteriia bacterium]|nr:deoxyribodipyrimidine photolyase [Terriglobia bacterium]